MEQIENAIIVSPLDEKIEQALVKVNVTNLVIDTLKAKYGDLKLRNLDDKEKYLEIKQAKKDCVKVRNIAVKCCTEGRDDANKVRDKWIDKQKEVVGRISEVEDALDAEIERFENHVKELEQAEKKRQEEAYMLRTQAITKMGALYHDSSFTIGDFTLEAALVKESSPEVWENEILPRFAEEHLKIEGERVEKERFEAEKSAEFERRQAEFRQQQEEFRKQKEAAEMEVAKQRQELQRKRVDLLYPYYKSGQTRVDMNNLWSMSEPDFNNLLAEKKAAHEKEQAEWVAAMQEQAAQKERERIAEEQRQSELRKQQEEAKRQEELSKAADKEKWADVVSWLQKCPPHEFRSSQYRTKMKHVKDFLNEILKPL